MTACLLGSCGCPPLVASASFSSALPKRALLLPDNVVGGLRKTSQGIPISRTVDRVRVAPVLFVSLIDGRLPCMHSSAERVDANRSALNIVMVK